MLHLLPTVIITVRNHAHYHLVKSLLRQSSCSYLSKTNIFATGNNFTLFLFVAKVLSFPAVLSGSVLHPSLFDNLQSLIRKLMSNYYCICRQSIIFAGGGSAASNHHVLWPSCLVVSQMSLKHGAAEANTKTLQNSPDITLFRSARTSWNTFVRSSVRGQEKSGSTVQLYI